MELFYITLKAFQLAGEIAVSDPLPFLLISLIGLTYTYHYFARFYRGFHTIIHLSLLAFFTAQVYIVWGFRWAILAWFIAALCDFNDED